MSLEIVPIHKHPEYFYDCCRIINQEWPRSDTARLHGFQQSCDTLPTNLVLLKEKIAIGHVKLSLIPSIRTACFVETLVVEKSQRGRGYGSIFMRKVENFCRALGLRTIYLSTTDQERFYAKLGYTECGPVSIYGNFMSTVGNFSYNNQIQEAPRETHVKRIDYVHYPPPPPPPPMPELPKETKNVKTYMKKEIFI